MVGIFQRGASCVTFCTAKCFYNGESFLTKKWYLLLDSELLNGDLSYDFMEAKK